MSSQYRFSLDKSSKKFICPQCNKKSFVRYKDNETDNYFEPNNVGRCDREHKCSFHYPPKDYFRKHPSLVLTNKFVPKMKIVKDEPSFIPYSNYEKYRKLTDDYFFRCGFFNYLMALFSDSKLLFSEYYETGLPFKAASIIAKYKLTASGQFWIADNKYPDGVVFWQFDYQKQIRTAKVMRYDAITGKRIKKPVNYISWVHNSLKYEKKISNFNLQQCFFGEHLLSDYPNARVAIVESEKTACIMSVILDEYIWIATGGSNGTKWKEASVYNVLFGRDVTLFPDLGQYDKWYQQSLRFQSVGLNIQCSEFLKKNVSETDKKNGYDIADYAIANRWYI